MKKKILYLVAFSIILNLMIFVAGCCVPGACCGGDVPRTFDIFDMTAQNVTIDSANNFSSGAVLPDQSVVTASEFGIMLLPEVNYASISKPNWQMQGFLINTAYACSPLPPSSDEMINSISVFSDTDFVIDGQTFVAGDTLNELFDIRDNEKWEQVSLDQYNAQTEDKSASEYEHLLNLIQSPDAAEIHRFTIHYSQTNGEFYSMVTESVEITP